MSRPVEYNNYVTKIKHCSNLYGINNDNIFQDYDVLACIWYCYIHIYRFVWSPWPRNSLSVVDNPLDSMNIFVIACSAFALTTGKDDRDVCFLSRIAEDGAMKRRGVKGPLVR